MPKSINPFSPRDEFSDLPERNTSAPLTGSFTLYQLRAGLENRELRYEPLDRLRDKAQDFREKVHTAIEDVEERFFTRKSQAEAWFREQGFDIRDNPDLSAITVCDDMQHESTIYLVYGQDCCRVDGCDTQALDTLVERSRYERVYQAPLPKECEGLTDPDMILNIIYYKLNMEHPADYHADSMSVSDVVTLNQNGQTATYYTDRIGFQRLNSFLEKESPLRNAEMSMEDDFDMLDGIINNGPRRDDEAEPLSVVNQLKEYRESSAHAEPRTPHPGKEQEL